VLARDRFILDGLGAERAFHRLTWLPAASDRLDLIPGAPQFIEQKIPLAKQLVTLGNQRQRHRNVARA
jgi:hypothetical protein